MTPINQVFRTYLQGPMIGLNVSNLREALSQKPLAISGTISALYDADCSGYPVLIKVFSRNWSRHTRDFCDWAYGGEPLTLEKAHDVGQSVVPYVERLLKYGLDVIEPLEVWTIPDPFTIDEAEWSVALVVPKLSYPTAHQHLFTLRYDRKAFLNLFDENILRVLIAIQAAHKMGDLNGPIVQYGFDPKPRNFLREKNWWYVDSLPVLNPEVLNAYRKTAPQKAFWKRFDTRYYLFDVLMRYYRIQPDLLDDLRNSLFRQILLHEYQSAEYIMFINESIDAYREKWGHMLPDKE